MEGEREGARDKGGVREMKGRRDGEIGMRGREGKIERGRVGEGARE